MLSITTGDLITPTVISDEKVADHVLSRLLLPPPNQLHYIDADWRAHSDSVSR
jgi:hypothetical protein